MLVILFRLSAKNGRQEKERAIDYLSNRWVGLCGARTGKYGMPWSEEGEDHIDI